MNYWKFGEDGREMCVVQRNESLDMTRTHTSHLHNLSPHGPVKRKPFQWFAKRGAVLALCSEEWDGVGQNYSEVVRLLPSLSPTTNVPKSQAFVKWNSINAKRHWKEKNWLSKNYSSSQSNSMSWEAFRNLCSFWDNSILRLRDPSQSSDQRRCHRHWWQLLHWGSSSVTIQFSSFRIASKTFERQVNIYFLEW